MSNTPNLRDLFAAHAMQIAHANLPPELRKDPQKVADRAYELADAMLRERSKS